MKIRAWLSFFRAVNIATVPGDILVGVAAVLGWVSPVATITIEIRPMVVVGACFASICLYLFGLADNDLVGMKTDGPERPIPHGDISPRAAMIARGVCLITAILVGILTELPPLWWQVAWGLIFLEVLYNRLKWALVMGLCRGLNVLCGAAAVGSDALSISEVSASGQFALALAVLIWTLFIFGVTRYAAGEREHPERRPQVGILLGSLVYLQLLALLFFTLQTPAVKPLLITGAFLLIALRLSKRLMSGVSAS